MRISHLALVLALVSPAIVAAQSEPEITEQSVVQESAPAPAIAVEVAQRVDRDFGGNRENGGVGGGNLRRNSDHSNGDGGFSRRDGNAGFGRHDGGAELGSPSEQTQQTQQAQQAPSQAQPEFRPAARFDPPAPQATPQFERNPFGRGGRGGSTLDTSPAQQPQPQQPQSQAQNGGGDGDFRGERGDRFRNRDGSREGRRDDAFGRRFGNRGDNGPQIDTTPQRRPEGQVFDQNRDGRFGQNARPDINRGDRGRGDVNRGDANQDRRNGVFGRDWRRDGGRSNESRDGRYDGNRGGRFDGNRNDRFDGNRGGTSNHRFERQGGGWVDRGNRYGNDYNRNWNREWRGDRRYNWQGYRNQYRNNYRQPRYYNPYGYGYGYQRFGIGIYLNSLFFSSRYWINDPYEYRLPAAPYGYRWIRYYDDVLLVDQRNGYVVDVIHNFFW